MVMISEARKYQAFYTKSTPIVDFMIQRLSIQPSDKVFEPCGGDGVFIDALLEENQCLNIDVCELNPTAVDALESKFSEFPNVKIRLCDTLIDNELITNSCFGGKYDKIIANPPYGAWQDYDKRVKMKKLYPGLYVKESYALFLYRCLELLKDGGTLSFIIPDTYLNLHMHKAIRKHVLTKSKIVDLALFPSSFFPGVNFGYANLSILTLQKCDNAKECLDNVFTVMSGFSKVEQLTNVDNTINKRLFKQKDILASADYAFLLSEDTNVNTIINTANLRIGDIAHCVTGFYSGCDKKFLKALNKDVRNAKNYEVVEEQQIAWDSNFRDNILEGIKANDHYVPIVKGGNVKFLKKDNWFMNWSVDAIKHYKTDKKARFQNPQYYFKFGIGVPMISSSSITASLIDNKLFDQSIVGIFPKNNDRTLAYYLLAFFNSPTCNTLIRTINPSANNPANYIKKIPFIEPSQEQRFRILNIVKEILLSIETHGSYNEELEKNMHREFKTIYGF